MADDLAARGAIGNATIYRLGADYSDKSHQLKAGSFLIEAGASMAEIVDEITGDGRSTCGTQVIYLVRVNGQVTRVRGSRTEGLSIAINLQWQEVGEVTGQVDYNTDGLGAIELLMTESGVRCAGVYKFTTGFAEGRFNGTCGDGSSFTGTFRRTSPQTFYAEGSDTRRRRFNGLFTTFR